MHASEWLKEPGEKPPAAINVVYGSEGFFRQRVLSALKTAILGSDGAVAEGGDDEDEMCLSRYSGQDLELSTVLDELRTVSMWGGTRLVIVDDADSFITEHRGGLEKYVQAPARKGVLLLLPSKWPKNTRLAKLVDKTGLAIECTGAKGAALSKWVVDHAASEYSCRISREAAALLIAQAGESLSLLDQELSKLSSYAGDAGEIGPEVVALLTGGWRMETTWAMTDAIQDGQVDRALDLLGQMLDAGEAPQKLMGGLSFVFRKLAAATGLSASGMNLQAALRKAGVFPKALGSSEAYLRRIGRPEAEQILPRLLKAETRLRSTSGLSSPRLVVELLVLELAGVSREPAVGGSSR